MTPAELLDVYDLSVMLSRELWARTDSALVEHDDLAREAYVRLQQLYYLLKRSITFEQEEEDLDRARADGTSSTEEADRDGLGLGFEIGDLMLLYGEAFYFFAFRLRTVLQRMPGFGGFECAGVRDVRDKLIEHPEKRREGVMWRNYMIGGPEGLVIKPLGPGPDSYRDKGLYPNAEEFVSELLPRLHTALNKLRERPA